jgi:hypothetical protein
MSDLIDALRALPVPADARERRAFITTQVDLLESEALDLRGRLIQALTRVEVIDEDLRRMDGIARQNHEIAQSYVASRGRAEALIKKWRAERVQLEPDEADRDEMLREHADALEEAMKP